MSSVKLYDILWRVKNAGPSPDDNRRTELYFAGCQKALSGDPCKNCFNPSLWDGSKNIPLNPVEIVDQLDRQNIPKYITIVGGEPTDQLEGLVELISILKKRGYHIMLFTWHKFKWIKEMFGRVNLKNIDILVTEVYVEEQRIYNTDLDDGVHNVIGSGNQRIITELDKRWPNIIKADRVESMTLTIDNKLIIKEQEVK